MTRKNKYRALNLENQNEWVYGSLLRKGFDELDIMMLPWISGRKLCKIVIQTIGLYTELHDSKGNEIYEGDIICAKSKLNKDEIFYFTVYFGTDGKNYGWCLKKMGKISNGLRTDILYWVNNRVEVVGNIYEGMLNEEN